MCAFQEVDRGRVSPRRNDKFCVMKNKQKRALVNLFNTLMFCFVFYSRWVRWRWRRTGTTCAGYAAEPSRSARTSDDTSVRCTCRVPAKWSPTTTTSRPSTSTPPNRRKLWTVGFIPLKCIYITISVASRGILPDIRIGEFMFTQGEKEISFSRGLFNHRFSTQLYDSKGKKFSTTNVHRVYLSVKMILNWDFAFPSRRR